MNQETLNFHYKNIANKYDSVFSSKTEEGKKGHTFLGEEGAKDLVRMLKLQKYDKLVDLGAGTCTTAGMLVRLGNLTQPVLCVDPVQEMLDVAEANKMENIETLCETAEEFTKRQIKYDKILIKGTVHHFPAENIQNIFTGIYNQLNEGGILLIEKLSGNKNAGIPFFKRGKEVQLEVHQGLTEKLVSIFESLKFKKVEKFAIECHTSKTKDEAIAHIKNRSASSWATLTEDEIEDGVKDVQENFGDIIEYITEMEIIIATK